MKLLMLLLAALMPLLPAMAGDIPVTETSPGVYETGEVPDGNYLVTLTLDSGEKDATVSVFAESRRLFFENVELKRDSPLTLTFCVNKRDSIIRGKTTEKVRLKPRERGKLNWDSRLTVEIVGAADVCGSICVEPAPEDVTTVFLVGNSTVVDNDADPYSSWGQMVTRWFGPEVCFANYAESGESAVNFISARRWAKLLTQARPGDYVMIEFGHNDQKQKYAGAGAYYNFSTALKTMIDQARAAGVTPVLVTPTCRRSFDGSGHIQPTHGDYPDAMRLVGKREGVDVIELQEMTKVFYEAMGEEPSKRAFVHYPANTFPGQTEALEDNTHFNPYGAYEIAKMIVEGMRRLDLPVLKALREDYTPFDPALPDDRDSFLWLGSDKVNTIKPDGN